MALSCRVCPAGHSPIQIRQRFHHATQSCPVCATLLSGTKGQTMSRFLKLAVIIAGAATLAACGQSPLRTQHSDFRSSATRQAAIEYPRRPVAVASVVRRTPAPEPGESRGKSNGLASFYSEGGRTASGEKFNPNELTA